MSRTLLAVAALAATAVFPTAAFAKPPKDAPSIDEIYQQAKQALDKSSADKAAQAKDTLREAIDNYRDKKSPRAEYAKLVECLNDAKDDKVQAYRADAASALIMRFAHEDDTPDMRTDRRNVALAVLDLMKTSQKDEIGLRAIEQILLNWWKMPTLMNFKFHATDKQLDRAKSWAKAKKFLDKGESN